MRKILAVTLVILIALAAALGVIWLKKSRAARYPVLYVTEIKTAAAESGISPVLVASVIMAESSYRPDAVSGAGAVGLMQIMPETGEWLAGKLGLDYAPELLYDPAVNIRMGAWYLGFLSARYGGDARCACAAYFQGQGTVDKWLSDPAYSKDGRTLDVFPTQATQTYVLRIEKFMKYYEKAYGELD